MPTPEEEAQAIVNGFGLKDLLQDAPLTNEFLPIYDTLISKIAAALKAREADLEAFWFAVENGWDIEPRKYFEAEAPKNGFGSPLAMAVHYMWKRERRDSAAAQQKGSDS